MTALPAFLLPHFVGGNSPAEGGGPVQVSQPRAEVSSTGAPDGATLDAQLFSRIQADDTLAFADLFDRIGGPCRNRPCARIQPFDGRQTTRIRYQGDSGRA